ncbi:MAG: alpha/beta hydrolase [Ignavibacteriae bacterium]|nr:alpha/beta hydrolase [Ignavibacteriota bacterium]
MKEIYFNNLKISDYEGSGKPLVFIHAFPLSSEMWNPQTEYFSSKFRVITYDVRGLGKSKSEHNQFTMETYANDLLSVLNHLNLEDVFACGLSMGGYILQRAYIKKPESFKALVLADTRSERDDNNGLINRSNVIENLKAGKRKQFISEFLQKLVNKKSYENPLIRNFLENIIEGNSTEGICGAQLALATRINATEYLRDFKVPVLILVGENDILTPVSSAESMKSRIPESEMKIIKNSGHLSNIENTEEFNRCLSEFLEKFV